MSYLKYLRYFTLVMGLVLLLSVSSDDSVYNNPDAQDINTTGIVLHKQVETIRKTRSNGRTKKETRKYLWVTYEINTRSFEDPKVQKRIKKFQIQNFKTRNSLIQKDIDRIECWLVENNYLIENYLLSKILVTRGDALVYTNAKVGNEINVIYQSHRPYDAHINLDRIRAGLPRQYFGSALVILLSIIGFCISFYDRRHGIDRYCSNQ